MYFLFSSVSLGRDLVESEPRIKDDVTATRSGNSAFLDETRQMKTSRNKASEVHMQGKGGRREVGEEQRRKTEINRKAGQVHNINSV